VHVLSLVQKDTVQPTLKNPKISIAMEQGLPPSVSLYNLHDVLLTNPKTYQKEVRNKVIKSVVSSFFK